MTSLHTLLTALIRLIGIYHVFKVVDTTLAWLTFYQDSSNMKFMGLIYVLIQLLLAIFIFLIAPKIAQLLVGEKEGAKNVNLNIAVIFCTGVVIIAWGVSKISDLLNQIIYRSSTNPDGSTGEIGFDLSISDSLYILTCSIMILGGAYVIIKCDKIGAKFLRNM